MLNCKNWTWPGILSVVILAALANGYQGPSVEEDLTAKTTRLIEGDHPWASVKADRRDLIITGFAPSADAAKAVLDLARKTNGARIIIDETEPLAAANPYRLNIAKSQNGIVLKGNAPDHQTRDAIMAAAQQISEGREVENKLELAAGAPAAFEEFAGIALRMLPGLSSGAIDLTDTAISFSGVASTLEGFDQIATFMENLPTGYELAESTLVPPAVSPYRWSVSKHASGITIRGHVPSVEAREQVISDANRIFATTDIVDLQVLASGDPAQSSQARTLLQNLVARLDAGQGNMVDQTVSIAGRVNDTQVAKALEADLLSQLPQGYTGSTNIMVPAVAASVEETAPVVASPFIWEITKAPEGVTISGNVTSPEVAAATVELAKMNLNVAEVSDNQQIANGAPQRIVEAREFIIRQLRVFDSGTGRVTDTTVTLKGQLKNNNLAGLVERAIKQQLPEGYTGSVDLSYPTSEKITATALVVKPPVADPFRWSVSKLPSGVTVLGNVSSESIRAANIDLIKSRLGVEELTDKQSVARGAPDDIDEVIRLLINQVRFLEAGQGNIIGNIVSVTGKARNQNIRNLIDRTVTGRLPQGFTGTTNIVFPKSEVKQGSAPRFVVNDPEPEAETQPAVEPAPELEGEAAVCQQNIVNAVDGRNIKFETARAIIEADSRRIVDDVIKAAKECPEVRFQIGGHTDSRGRESYNQSLSETRARSVVRYMVNAGIDPERVTARGFGEASPVADNDTSEGRAKNRRIEFKVIQ